ncbi:NAD(P)/FAD-dependent oxidoreductase [Occultella aeris]|uniref:Anthranilate 1,2-dioxygenase system ferredoxin--NAD(+) reductase component n=1 Tax=Occultella aeris TaxID=2761496 RepID=A0A7M4DI34_9MICO|nr:FAD-dependent oxidoreductase [Occultella aeris]VZO36598.1 Anthranilate 1,2-dioxygenase system ferredoxin--NAD(+) reductase component [Occultella aeris]
MAEQTFVIIGGGLAGATAATTLREQGFTGRVVLFAAEDEVPYIRPPLSKEFLAGSADRAEPQVHPESWYAENSVELRRGTPVRELRPAAHEVLLAGGETLGYDKVLLATGASSRHLRGDAYPDLRGVYYLRTFADSEALRATLADGGRRVVIVGAGWIGLEVAAAARGYGNQVTVLGREDVPLEPALGAELGAYFGALHARNGVDVRMRVEVAGFVGESEVTGVRLAEGEVVGADVVVVGVGAAPNTELAQAAGLRVDGGVVVDAALCADGDGDGLADVYAAGDVASAFHPVLGTHLHVDHWANAERQGAAAARSMLGQDVSFDRAPYFYTDQFDLGMEFSGYGDLMPGSRVVYRGDVGGGEFIAFWVAGPDDGARVVAGMNVNVWDVNEAIDALIASGRAVDVARLADPEVGIAEL